MDDMVGMQDLQSLQDIEGHLPDEVLAELLMLLTFLLY
jgi:hypothetical protein